MASQEQSTAWLDQLSADEPSWTNAEHAFYMLGFLDTKYTIIETITDAIKALHPSAYGGHTALTALLQRVKDL